MRRLLVEVALALLILATGVGIGARWQAHRSPSQIPSSVKQEVEQVGEQEYPLTKELISRSLQSHAFRTDNLRRNSHNKIVWRWLKESIANYPQNWVRLDISYDEIYGVVLYPQKNLSSAMLTRYNRELKEKGMSLLREGKRYLPIDVYQGDIICPSWSGLVDVEEAKLVYFLGMSG